MATDAIDAAQWLRANTARTRSGLSPTSLTHLALAGRIRVLALPGLPIRYHGDDCDAIRRELAGEPAGRSAAGDDEGPGIWLPGPSPIFVLSARTGAAAQAAPALLVAILHTMTDTPSQGIFAMTYSPILSARRTIAKKFADVGPHVGHPLDVPPAPARMSLPGELSSIEEVAS